MYRSRDDKRLSVLLVDDDPVFRLVLAEELKASGCTVTHAGDPQAALAAYAKEPATDIAVLDLEMPGMTGADLAERLHPLAVLFVTQHDEYEAMKGALGERVEARVLGYVAKQLEPPRIALIVRAAGTFAREVRAKQIIMETTALALERERRRIAQELHDELGQSMAAILLDAKGIEAAKLPRDVKEKAQRITAAATSVNEAIDRIIERLRPEVLDTLGTHGAIESMAAEWRRRLPDVAISFEAERDLDVIEGDLSTTVYRVVQECLTNAVKHSGAKNVRISIRRQHAGGATGRHTLRVEVSDDGTGIREGEEAAGRGLRNVEQRATALGGRVQVSSHPGRGTQVSVELPIQ